MRKYMQCKLSPHWMNESELSLDEIMVPKCENMMIDEDEFLRIKII